MNLSQLMRKARFEVDAIRASGAKSGLWTDEEVTDAVNTAMDHAARLIRLSDSNMLSKTIKSTDAAIDMVTESYDPTSLKLQISQTEYTLPPDCVRIDNIIPLSSGFEGVRFYPAKTTQKGWIDQQTLTIADLTAPVQNSEQVYYYTIIGERTLKISPLPVESFDITVQYQFRPQRLINYSTGTIDLVLNSTTLHGHGTLWLARGVRAPAELITGSVDNCDLNTVYPRITNVTSQVDATLARAWPDQNFTGIYHISMVPQLPTEHHGWLAQAAAAVMLRKISLELSKASLEEVSSQFYTGVEPEVTIRQVQESLPVDEYQLP